MSSRPNIPDGDRYRAQADLASECASMVFDLINQGYVFRLEAHDGVKTSAICSEVFEAVKDDDSTGESFPAVRVRREVNERVQHLVNATQKTGTSSDRQRPISTVQIYTLEFGVEHDNPEPYDAEFDVHDMYDWTPAVSAVIQKNSLAKEDDFIDYDNFNHVQCQVIYTDSGEKVDDFELVRLMHLLNAILYTAREASVYDDNVLPASSMLRGIGHISTRFFEAMDIIGDPCSDCLARGIACVHAAHEN